MMRDAGETRFPHVFTLDDHAHGAQRLREGEWGNPVSPSPNRWWGRPVTPQAGVRFDRLTAGGSTGSPQAVRQAHRRRFDRLTAGGETRFPRKFTSVIHAAAPHNDKMNMGFSWEGCALPNPPAGGLCSPQTVMSMAHNAAMNMGYLWEGRPLPGPPPLG